MWFQRVVGGYMYRYMLFQTSDNASVFHACGSVIGDTNFEVCDSSWFRTYRSSEFPREHKIGQRLTDSETILPSIAGPAERERVQEHCALLGYIGP